MWILRGHSYSPTGGRDHFWISDDACNTLVPPHTMVTVPDDIRHAEHDNEDESRQGCACILVVVVQHHQTITLAR